MHFKFLSLSSVLVFSLGFSLSTEAQDGAPLVPPDSSVSVKQSIDPASYKPCLFVSGFVANSNNSSFYNNFFQKGNGIQVGVPLFSHKYYTLRFNLGYTQYAFVKDAYSKWVGTDGKDALKFKNLETITVSPDVLLHPFPKFIVSPYVNVGLGVVVGSKDPSVTRTNVDGSETTTLFSFGTRYLAQIGGGALIDLLPWLGIMAGVTYNREFLENNEGDDIFYKFERPADTKYKFLHYHLGVVFKFRK